MRKNKKIVFTWWGTGGHVLPIISLYNYMSEGKNIHPMWLWERNSLEENASMEHGIEFHEISAGKIRRYFDWRNFYEPLKNLTGIFQALFFLIKYKGDVIFSKGWFVSLPVIIAAFILRKKIYIHESDTHMGLSNKIGSLFATKVFTSFPVFHGKKIQHSGHIMNPEMLDYISSSSKKENDFLNVLVIAGSQGSQRIFNAISKVVPDCHDIIFHIVLGTNTDEELKKNLMKYPNVHTYGFVSQRELAKLYIAADIALTRGSSTLWELFYFGVHSIIIPLKETGGDHQTKNAEYFHKNYGSDVLMEGENLPLEIFRKLQKYKHLRKKDLNLEGFLDGVKSISEHLK